MGLLGPKGGAQGGAQGSPPKGLYKQREGAHIPFTILGGAASVAQGRAARDEVLATALPASICTTPTRYRSSATARLVVIP